MAAENISSYSNKFLFKETDDDDSKIDFSQIIHDDDENSKAIEISSQQYKYKPDQNFFSQPEQHLGQNNCINPPKIVRLEQPNDSCINSSNNKLQQNDFQELMKEYINTPRINQVPHQLQHVKPNQSSQCNCTKNPFVLPKLSQAQTLIANQKYKSQFQGASQAGSCHKIKYGTGIWAKKSKEESKKIENYDFGSVSRMLSKLNCGNPPTKETILKNLRGYFQSMKMSERKYKNIPLAKRKMNWLLYLIDQNPDCKDYLLKNWALFDPFI